MKNIFLTLVIIYSTFNSFSQTFSSESVPWFSGKNFPTEGHSSSRVRYDNSIRKFRYTEYSPSSSTNWYHFSSILHGGGNINFLTHQSWNTVAPGMAADGTFDPNQFAQNFTRMTITPLGSVGMGTTAPAQRLHISGGNLRIDNPISGGQGTDGRIIFGDNNIYISGQNNPNYQGFELSNKLRIGTNFSGYNANGFELLVPGGAMIRRLSIEEKLYVGTKNRIENSMGNFTMVVEGKLGAREIEVKMGSWADYVFEEKYNLKSLNELEDFIKENKHLPNVPSESQVIEHGFSINEMAKIQMEKIEELTLYTIQQQKLIEQLIKEVEELKKK